jgi:hypothetical protein
MTLTGEYPENIMSQLYKLAHFCWADFGEGYNYSWEE